MLTDSNELIGQALGTCTLQRLLGRGGMGAVYLARQSRPRRTVAVKVLMPGVFMEHQTSGEFLTRFRREADAVAALDHINIMPIYEYGEQDSLAYLVMPYVTGGTLRQVLEQRPILSLSETLTIVDQAASALDSAHEQGIVHRDLKPGNMMFHADGRLLLADFGLAKTIKEARESEGNGHTALTSAGTIVGTPEYLSPEQGTGKDVDSRTDIYSLGIVIFQMLAGRVPFQGPSPVAVAIKHALEEPPSLTSFNPDISPGIEAVVRKAIAKNPNDRYSSAGELARALRHAAMQINATPRTLEALEEGTSDPVKLNATPGEEVSPELHGAPTEENPRMEAPATKEHQPTTEPPASAPEEASTLITKDLEEEPPQQPPARPKPSTRRSDPPAQPHPVIQNRRAPESTRAPGRPTSPTRQDAPVRRPEPVAERPATARERPGERVQVMADARSFPAYELGNGKLRPRRTHPVPMMLLGSLITLMIVTGILGGMLYLRNQQQTPQKGHNSATANATATAANTPGRTTPAPLPAVQVPAGPLLYGANRPGPQCDSNHDAKWSKTSNATLTCENQVSRLSNTGGNGLAATYLTSMPGKSYPGDYIIQVQVDLSGGSNGPFGILFRHQSGGAFVYLIDPGAGTWTGAVYNEATGALDVLHTDHIVQGHLSGTITVDVSVQGQFYVLHINGTRQGGLVSDAHMQGDVGLAAPAGSNIRFKNMAIYAYQ